MLVADANGVVKGKFTVPPNIPGGTKTVAARGKFGTPASSLYTGKTGTLTVENRTVITTTVTHYYDPLAQTFVPTRGFHFAGIDLKFKKKGDPNKPVRVQLRDTDNGYPGPAILAEGQIIPAAFDLSGGWSRVLVNNPAWVDPDVERSVVVLTDDADHEVAIAQLGKVDPQRGYVTSQPYSVGVLFASSNNKAWTPIQDTDLTFRILGCQFAPQTRTIALGSFTATNLTDLLVLAGVQRPTRDTQVSLVLTRANGTKFTISEEQTVSFGEVFNEVVQVAAVLSGTLWASPIIFPNPQAVLGALLASGDYATRAFDVGNNARITTMFECWAPGSAAVATQYQSGGTGLSAGDWTDQPIVKQAPVGDGWVERTMVVDPVSIAKSRIRLRLSGNAANRPLVRNFRAVVSEHQT